MRRHRLITALALAACTPEPDPPLETPDIEWEGQWLRFGRSSELPPQCAGVAPYMDRYVGALVDLFAVDRDITVDFFYVDDMSTPCESLGCVKEHAVFSLVPVQEHELVHAVRSFEGFSHLLLEEGAAEHWGDDSTTFEFRHETAGSIVDAAETAKDGFAITEYGVAGRFHSFLVRDGVVEANALLRATDPWMDTAALSQHLEDGTGLTLEDWDAAFASYPTCDQAEFRDASAACASVPMVPRCLDGENVLIETYVGCEDEQTLGPRDGEIWKYLAVELEEAGEYSLYMSPDLEMQGGTVTVKQCTGGCGSVVEVYDVPWSAAPARFFDATPGTYLLRLSLPEGISGDFRVSIGGHCPP